MFLIISSLFMLRPRTSRTNCSPSKQEIVISTSFVRMFVASATQQKGKETILANS